MITVDEPAVQLFSRVEGLADLRARHVTAEKDVPERWLQLQAVELAVAGILTRMEREGEADPRRLLLGASTVVIAAARCVVSRAQIRELGRKR